MDYRLSNETMGVRLKSALVARIWNQIERNGCAHIDRETCARALMDGRLFWESLCSFAKEQRLFFQMRQHYIYFEPLATEMEGRTKC